MILDQSFNLFFVFFDDFLPILHKSLQFQAYFVQVLQNHLVF